MVHFILLVPTAIVIALFFPNEDRISHKCCHFEMKIDCTPNALFSWLLLRSIV